MTAPHAADQRGRTHSVATDGPGRPPALWVRLLGAYLAELGRPRGEAELAARLGTLLRP